MPSSNEPVNQAALAEELGDDVWLTEYHFWEDGRALSLLPIGSAIAMRAG